MPAGKREDFSVNTIIGPNTSINGDVDSAGFTRIDGSLCGNLSARGRIIIGERARMKSNITGTAVTIGGVVSGSVLASDRVLILATGIVLGDIITQRIQADEGCLLHGKVTVCQTREKWDSAVSEYRDTEDLKSVTAAFAPRLSVSGTPGAEFAPEDNIPATADYLAATEGVLAAAESPPFYAGAGSAPETETRATGSDLAEAPQENAPAESQAAPESAGAEAPRYWDMFKFPALTPPEKPAVADPVLHPEDAALPGDAVIPVDEAAFPEDTVIPAENAVFSGDAAAGPEEAAFPEDTAAGPEEAAFPEDAAARSEEAAFSGDTAAGLENAGFSEDAAAGPEEAAFPEDTAAGPEEAAFSGDTVIPAEDTVFPENTEVPPEKAAAREGEVPAASRFGIAGAEEKYGEN